MSLNDSPHLLSLSFSLFRTSSAGEYTYILQHCSLRSNQIMIKETERVKEASKVARLSCGKPVLIVILSSCYSDLHGDFHVLPNQHSQSILSPQPHRKKHIFLLSRSLRKLVPITIMSFLLHCKALKRMSFSFLLFPLFTIYPTKLVKRGMLVCAFSDVQ